MRKSLMLAKQAGMSAKEAYERLESTYMTSAKRDNWRPSELAATLADLMFETRRVFGKRATRFLFEDREEPKVVTGVAR